MSQIGCPVDGDNCVIKYLIPIWIDEQTNFVTLFHPNKKVCAIRAPDWLRSVAPILSCVGGMALRAAGL